MSLIKGIHHAAIKCSCPAEFKEVLHFYTEVLGLTVLRSWGEGSKAGAMIDTGCGVIEVFAAGNVSHATGSIHHLALATDDPGACIGAVRQAGYTITVEPKDVVIASEPPFPIRVAFAIGPCGEEIEFFHEK